MSDLGSKSSLQTDINAKCTTNGANENTGTRIRALFTNLIDTIYAAIPTLKFGSNAKPKYEYGYWEGVTSAGDGRVNIYPTADGLNGGAAIYSSVVVLNAFCISEADAPADALVFGNVYAESPTGIRVYMFAGNPSIAALDNALAVPADGIAVRVFFIGIPL